MSFLSHSPFCNVKINAVNTIYGVWKRPELVFLSYLAPTPLPPATTSNPLFKSFFSLCRRKRDVFARWQERRDGASKKTTEKKHETLIIFPKLTTRIKFKFENPCNCDLLGSPVWRGKPG
jgi:hypothetical protein